MSALARGRICLADGSGDAVGVLRIALAEFSRAELPMELARSRLAFAAAALAANETELAVAEAGAALNAFEALEASLDADAAAQLLRSVGGRVPQPRPADGVLTRRETEILALLGEGLSNPEISNQLFISRKTVEHHVSAILTKLEMHNRAEAAAYAARKKSVPK
jgi:DNA-binding NarL/FixJ family response regulator